MDQKRERLGSIDALRGIAALSVALYHVWGHDGGYAFPSVGLVPQSKSIDLITYLVSPMRWGYLGVSLFLVISGFCIHLPYARKKFRSGSYNFAPREFFVRRMWRLYPAYFVAIVGTCIVIWLAQAFTNVDLTGHMIIPTMSDLIGHLTMAHGFIESQFYSINSVFWSLSLEFQLYLAYPLFLFLFRKLGLRNSVIGIVVVSLIWRYIAIEFYGAGLLSVSAMGPYVLMGILPARMAEWIFGAALAEVFAKRNETDGTNVTNTFYYYAASIIVFVAAIASTMEPKLYSLTDILFGGSFVLLLAGVTLNEKPIIGKPSPIARFFMWLGITSYSFYLFHLQWIWILETQLKAQEGNAALLLVRLGWVLLGVFSIWLLFRLVEKPFMRPPDAGSKLAGVYNVLLGKKTA